ncbi:MAG: aspartate kinase [Bacteroidia bacterium]|nr:aspartate kinase [Bacteroidia bacterium]
MKVVKFGGTSVGSPERMHQLKNLIVNNESKIVVLSAVAGTTNALVVIGTCLHNGQFTEAKQLIESLNEKYKHFVNNLFKSDNYKTKGLEVIESHFLFIYELSINSFDRNKEKALLAQGELISTTLFHLYLEEEKINSVLLPALDFMRINEEEEPDLLFIEKNLEPLIKKNKEQVLFITQGYICRNSFGEIDNLKRGGSDYTACLIGAALRCQEIQIWTDIDGMHNNDPRVVNKTYPIAQLSFDEAAELAYFGAKILHPTCILPAQQRNIPVLLKNTMQPQATGTVIANHTSGQLIKAVAAKDGIIAIQIKSGRMLLAYGFLRRVFEIFERYKKPIDMITTSEVGVSLTIDDAVYLDEIKNELEKFCTVHIESNQSIVCIVGDGLQDSKGSASRILSCLSHLPVKMISAGGSKNNVSVLIDSSLKTEALSALNEGVFNLKSN